MIQTGQIEKFATLQRGLVFVHDEIVDGIVLNLGLDLAEELSKIDLNINFLPMMAEELLCGLLDKGITEDNGKRRLIVCNIGILFEKQLLLDVSSIFNRYSRNCLIVVQTEGKVIGTTFFPFGEGNGISVNLENIPFLEI